MTFLIRLELDSGSTTCASSKGNFCKYFGTKGFGQVPVCCLFPSDVGSYTELYEQDGWVQCCKSCLDAKNI